MAARTIGFEPGELPGAGFLIGIAVFMLLFYGVLGLIAMFFYSAYFREVIGTLKLGGLEFEFTARTMNRIKFVFATVAIVVFTFGIGDIS